MRNFTFFFVLSLGNPHIFYMITAHLNLGQALPSGQLSCTAGILAGGDSASLSSPLLRGGGPGPV